MAIQTPAGDDGTLNGATPVTLIAAPAASDQIVVMSITICNIDTVTNTIAIRKVSAGGTRVLTRQAVTADSTLVFSERVVLDDTGSSITAVMSGAATTTNPDWTASWLVNDV